MSAPYVPLHRAQRKISRRSTCPRRQHGQHRQANASTSRIQRMQSSCHCSLPRRRSCNSTDCDATGRLAFPAVVVRLRYNSTSSSAVPDPSTQASRLYFVRQRRLSDFFLHRHGRHDGRQYRARHQLLGDIPEVPFAGPGRLRRRYRIGCPFCCWRASPEALPIASISAG